MSLGFVVETDKAHIIMFFRRSADTAAVPVGLLTAVIDIINVAKPEPQNVEPLITSMARRFNYDHKTVLALMERIRAKNKEVIINLTAGMGGDVEVGAGEKPLLVAMV